MGNTNGLPWNRPLKSTDASAMFYALDVDGLDRLTLKNLMNAADAGLMMPHSLPALFFFDEEKDGTLTHAEFVSLVHFCHSEKRKVEDALSHDKPLRDLILRASRAGVKDCSVHGRSSYRRFSSYSNVRSVFSSRDLTAVAQPSALGASPAVPAGPSTGIPPRYPSAALPPSEDRPIISRSPSDSSDDALLHPPVATYSHCPDGRDPTSTSSESPLSSDADDPRVSNDSTSQPGLRTVAMYSSQREFDIQASTSDEDPGSNSDVQNPQNRTALDAAVVENIMHANIHKLADLLHTEGSREQFMSWLWNLANFNSSGVVTLEELRVFLSALSEDGIDLEELVFYKEVGVPLEECIINEFDTTHAGLLSRDEFMVLADLVTREYEFWENRHMERIGDYEMGRTIGRGSSGVVRLAMHVESREKVAIKIIKKGKCSDLSRLDREIQSLMAAKHENIVALKEVLDSESNLFIVMELCGGGSLVDIVRLYPEERMPEETARFFMRQVFEALAFCHQNGICHRDVRLDNLMLDNAGNVKITDFGHSGIYTPGWDLFSTSLVGSVYNLSPEQITGQLYSGEKIDVWSAGVAVYCLLVGQPPFFEPEVTPLLERITACDFETPDFLSPKAKDFIHCMIRAVPEERITIQQMLHHPWFYGGPEYGPSMNVVMIPVDGYFKKRPDIAEMIMAITIYQHHLHFHLADTQNPNSSPEDQRGQDWALKCLCPKNDIKFTVSLFTREPYSLKKNLKTTSQLPYRGSCSMLPDLPEGSDASDALLRRAGSTGAQQHETVSAMTRENAVASAREKFDSQQTGAIVARKDSSNSENPTTSTAGLSASRPPLHKKVVKVTPMNVAAHIRDKNPSGSKDSGVFDFECDGNSRDFSVDLSREDMLSGGDVKDDGAVSDKVRKGRHSRSHSLDGAGSWMRINRSATVDAFPYQKVYPQRKMPDSARNLNFDKPDVPSSESRERDLDIQDTSLVRSSAQLHRFNRSITLHAVSSLKADSIGRSPTGTSTSSMRDNEIAQKLSRHPSKAVSPQSPQIRRSPPQEQVLDNVEDLNLTSPSFVPPQTSQTLKAVAEKLRQQNAHYSEVVGSSSQVTSVNVFQSYIEVRLQDGESGVFLKICRKLKNICATKLAAAAERQKKKTGGRRSWSTLRRTASARSIGSDVIADVADAQARAQTFESRAERALA